MAWSNITLVVFVLNTLAVQFVIQAAMEMESKGQEPYKRVVNGNAADRHEWPWQVSIEKNNRHICGGSLVKKDWVLTAAHCIEEDADIQQYTVIVGAHVRSGSTVFQERLAISNILRHKEYSMFTFTNDVALFQLEKAVNISEGVQLIDLPTQEQRVQVGTKCYITGWGRNEHGVLMNHLQEAELKIDDFNSCNNKMKGIKRIDEDSMLCAIGEDQGGCRGDSGGPLACLEGSRWILRGVVSWGHQCLPDYHTVFARVSSFVQWINTYTVCEDKYWFCSFYKFQCEVYDYMIKNCRATCEFC